MANDNSIIINISSDSKLIEGTVGIGQTILPGALVSFSPLGTITNYIGAPSLIVPMLIAIENISEGLSIDDAYAAGDTVYVRHFRAGDVFQVRYTDIGISPIGSPIGASVTNGQLDTVVDDNEAICYGYTAGLAGVAGRLVSVFAK